RRDDFTHDLSSSRKRQITPWPNYTPSRPCPGNTLKSGRFCFRNKQPSAVFSGNIPAGPGKCSQPMHIALARALLPSR
ncbi:hypothetical protein, partial [Bradyrhizobium sp.]|uniref:hypothetical protein n=1 Tax=Bradyrhizobium sp. TaxID=376 RepID=UPI0025C57942